MATRGMIVTDTAAAQQSAPSIGADALKALVGKEVGVSDWIKVDQAMIDTFADVTGDHQFIHVDAARAKAETPFGGTIAHGFLVLSLLSKMFIGTVPRIAGTTMGVNYGFDKVRFLTPVPSGARIRGRFTLIEADERAPGEITSRYAVAVEIEGAHKPALAAEWLTRAYLGTTP